MNIVLCLRPIVGTTKRLRGMKRRESIVRVVTNRDGNGPLHDHQWTLVQNPRRALK
jgi:hypothetical protein